MQPQTLSGRYQLERELGRGGMASVYLARDLKLGRPVAIKLLHDYYASDPQFRQRFEHEAQTVATLNHINIVKLIDIGQDGTTPYLIMEYIEGNTLKQIIDRQGAMAPEQAVTIIKQVAQALDAAHRIGLVHRDVKPQNIMIAADGQTKLMDFGIAKGARSPGLTDPGVTFGTAEYISPEQAQGQQALPQSDLYSLGIVFFELLTGRLPFTGDTALALAMQHIQGQPPAPRTFNPRIPPTLEQIVMQLLAKDPYQRPGSAGALAQALDQYRLSGNQQTQVTPMVAPPPRPRQQMPATGPTIQQPAPRPQQYPQQQYPQQQPQRPMYTPPPAPLPEVEPDRGGGGCATLVLGIALLAGILGLLYVLTQTDLIENLQQATGGDATAAPAPTTAPNEPTAEPTPAPTGVELVAVPDVTNRTDAEARQILQDAGFSFAPTQAVNHPTVPQGFVISQEPAAAAEAPRGSEVRYTVSLGPQLIDVPDVTRQPFEASIGQLEALGFAVDVQQQPSREFQAGFVVAQDPQAGVRLPQGSTIRIVVSQGDVVVFPNIIGLKIQEAEPLVRSTDGLVLDSVDVQNRDRLGDDFDRFEADEVISATANGQPVVNGDLVPRGSTIIIGVRGPNEQQIIRGRDN